MSHQHNKHIGELSNDSPAFFVSLSRFLSKPEIAELSKLYRLAFNFGASQEISLERKPGQSFNPRGIRYCRLLIENYPRLSKTIFGASILTATFELNLSLFLEDFFEEASLYKYVLNFPTRSEPDVEAIVLVKQIDLLRHLHQMSISNEEKFLIVEKTRDNIIPHIKSQAVEKLLLIMQSWLQRFETQKNRFHR